MQNIIPFLKEVLSFLQISVIFSLSDNFCYSDIIAFP